MYKHKINIVPRLHCTFSYLWLLVKVILHLTIGLRVVPITIFPVLCHARQCALTTFWKQEASYSTQQQQAAHKSSFQFLQNVSPFGCKLMNDLFIRCDAENHSPQGLLLKGKQGVNTPLLCALWSYAPYKIQERPGLWQQYWAQTAHW